MAPFCALNSPFEALLIQKQKNVFDQKLIVFTAFLITHIVMNFIAVFNFIKRINKTKQKPSPKTSAFQFDPAPFPRTITPEAAPTLSYHERWWRMTQDFFRLFGAIFHFILFLMKENQTSCYVTWHQISVLYKDMEGSVKPSHASTQNSKHLEQGSPSYWEVVAEELSDAGESHPVVVVLHDAAAQQPDPLLPHPGGRALHVVQQLPRLAALQVAAHTLGQVECLLPPEGVKDNDSSNDGEDDDNPAARQEGVG